ncbi:MULTISPECIES: hypothetical protein [Microbacterium]|uniref:Uncharacterized protein n=1 Tax=Microbacterium maritypicum MF109 TaxID=1333857 RepID=T5KFU5_MICMQ|nr:MULTISPECIES: hypothetical protein [Microbacterium]EQM75925.1 hypothetical protein L687_18615 [Microbacterium maritypicum MF109]
MADTNAAYVQVKISQIDTEIKRHQAAIKELNTRKKGYQSQIPKKPAVVPTPVTPPQA